MALTTLLALPDCQTPFPVALPFCPSPSVGRTKEAKPTADKKPHLIDIQAGKRLRDLRAPAGLTHSALALKVALTFQQIQKYENGTNRMAAPRLWDFAGVFHVLVESFLPKRDGDPSPWQHDPAFMHWMRLCHATLPEQREALLKTGRVMVRLLV